MSTTTVIVTFRGNVKVGKVYTNQEVGQLDPLAPRINVTFRVLREATKQEYLDQPGLVILAPVPFDARFWEIEALD